MSWWKHVTASIALAATCSGPGSAIAQVYPSRPVTMIVPLAAGGPTDTLARIIAERMRGSLGQPIIVENVTGAAATIGVGKAARAAPDGYTISMGNWFTHVLNGAIYSLPYDLANDFEPISLLATNPLLILSKNAVPARGLKELIGWLRANQDRVSEGTSGVGSVSHISGIFFQNATRTRFQFVPYRGAAPAMQDLVAGQIDLMFDQISSSLSYVRSGTVRAYAVTSSARATSAPEIPTVDETGLPGFHVAVWHALWAPKRTPKDIIDKLNTATTDALADPAVRRRLGDLGQEILPSDQRTPQALGAYHRAEIEKWWPIIKAANIKAE
jgi:tripartite-type tricarboxylate transporter receptor subunit TctC